MVWDASKPAGTDSLKNSDDDLRANFTEIELRRLDNLLPNASLGDQSGGATSVPNGWTLEGTPTLAYDTVDTGYGDSAIKITATGAGDEGMKVTLSNLKVSTKYQVFARVKVTAGDTASIKTTGAATNIDVDSTSATWETITGEFVTDASATDVVIKFVASADTDVAYFCGITCVEGDIPPANFIRKPEEILSKARAYLNAAQDDITTGTWVKVLLDAETYDVGSNFASNKFTVTIPGFYLLVGKISYSSLVTDKRYLAAIYNNGSSIAMGHSHASHTAGISILAQDIQFLAIDDYIELYCHHEAGVNTVDLVTGEYETYLSVHLLSKP